MSTQEWENDIARKLEIVYGEILKLIISERTIQEFTTSVKKYDYHRTQNKRKDT